MLETIEMINSAVSNFVWGVPAMVCILGVGLYLSLRTGFLQIRKFPYAIRTTLGRIFRKREASDGALTPFQAVCTALAATVGTGNIAGVAGAIAIGGPGAIFWMWVSALFGMCTKFSEVTLAVHFRERNEKGDLVGGPMYYIKNGLGKHWQWLGILFSAFGVLTVFGTGNATQVNTITTAIDSALLNYQMVSDSSIKTVNLVLGIVIAAVVAIVLLGGVKRIGSVTEKLVPFMALFYVILAVGVVVLNIKNVPGVLYSIVYGAFNPGAVTGGIVGGFFISIQKGVSRGIFSNEAGLGTGSIAHACADTQKPVKQGLFGIFEVFADTIVICTLTALVILCSGVPVNYGAAAGAELTILGFTSTYGNWVSIFTAVAMCCFAFSTILGWGLYGARCIEFLFSEKVIKPFMVVYALVSILGATIDLGLLWSIAETFNGLMSIPNLIALFMLSGTVVKLVKEYFENEGKEN
ncbi:MAG: sodium:alanine symporter family protein [Frisingicoccus sp.]|uniref:alanine/glycine:cation symporter family protein n=1 Tax=Frisingicoccus sp. TaxID=1918627 RepID=UPI0025C059B6|nr:sodium:alanine symporter family protein [Frisingicoccus sp.]MDY5955542.1 sodium:alanine symporter family protein [Frisingicoccus sp.]